jgi:hypothetical protein
MTSEEFREQRRQIANRRDLAERLVASKARREAAEKRERAARGSVAWAVQHHLDPWRIYEPQPRVQMPAFGGLRPTPTAYELDRRARRVDEILQSIL